MPRLIPVLNPNQIGNKGEREVYTRLRDQFYRYECERWCLPTDQCKIIDPSRAVQGLTSAAVEADRAGLSSP